MRVMIQLVGRTQHLLKVTAVIARRGFFLGPLTDNAQLFPAQLDDFGQYLFQIHRVLSPRPPGPPCLQSSRRQARSARHEAASRTRARPLTSGLSRAAIAAVTEADPWAQPTPDLAAEHPTPGPVRWQEKHPAPSAAQLESSASPTRASSALGGRGVLSAVLAEFVCSVQPGAADGVALDGGDHVIEGEAGWQAGRLVEGEELEGVGVGSV